MAIPLTTQLFPRSRRYDLQAGLAARMHDPAWLLLRQWQWASFTERTRGALSRR
jgi:hypothetical protein